MPVAVAGAAISAGASIYGASQAAGAAGKAADLSSKEVNFNNARTQPTIVAGDRAGSLLKDLNDQGFLTGQPDYLTAAQANIPNLPTGYMPTLPTLPDGTVPNANVMANLVNTPGYQFNLQQGLQAAQNSAAARGLGVSGSALKGAATYATGLADSTYQNQFNNQQTQFANEQTKFANRQTQFGNQQTLFSNQQNLFNNQQTRQQDYLNLNSAQQGNATNLYNRLAGTLAIGANTAVGAGSSGVAGTNAAGGFLAAAGNATAAGYAGAGNAINSAAQNYLSNSTLQGLIGNNSPSVYPVGDSTYSSLAAHPALSGIY